MLTANLSDVIAVSSDGNYPFDLRFTSKKSLSYDAKQDSTDITAAQHYVGPGIYFVFFKGHALTMGILKQTTSKHTNILEARWLRLLNRVTLRGVQTSFGKPRSSADGDKNVLVFDQYAQQLQQLLPDSLYAYIAQLLEFESASRQFNDTGSIATRADMQFASDHWETDFQTATEETILKPFQFVYYQLRNLAGATVKTNLNNVLAELEQTIASSYEFPLLQQAMQQRDNLSSGQLSELETLIEKRIGDRCRLHPAINLI